MPKRVIGFSSKGPVEVEGFASHKSDTLPVENLKKIPKKKKKGKKNRNP